MSPEPCLGNRGPTRGHGGTERHTRCSTYTRSFAGAVTRCSNSNPTRCSSNWCVRKHVRCAAPHGSTASRLAPNMTDGGDADAATTTQRAGERTTATPSAPTSPEAGAPARWGGGGCRRHGCGARPRSTADADRSGHVERTDLDHRARRVWAEPSAAPPSYAVGGRGRHDLAGQKSPSSHRIAPSLPGFGVGHKSITAPYVQERHTCMTKNPAEIPSAGGSTGFDGR